MDEPTDPQVPPPDDQRVMKISVATPEVGMVINFMWTKEMSRALQVQISRSLQPDQIIAEFLSKMGTTVSFGKVPKQGSVVV